MTPLRHKEIRLMYLPRHGGALNRSPDREADGPRNRWRKRVTDLPVACCFASDEFPRVGETLNAGDHL